MADFQLPHSQSIDGITLNTEEFGIVFQEKIDERKLTRKNDILVPTYPRAGNH